MLGVAAEQVIKCRMAEPPGETPELVVLVDCGIKGIRKNHIKVADIEAFVAEAGKKKGKKAPEAAVKEPEKAAEKAPEEAPKAPAATKGKK
ncbi:MAG: hypothetical protein JW908_00600 [Anaerolineales bacterium]|nr:hypothetical protein [Anaerolineales bacterium]